MGGHKNVCKACWRLNSFGKDILKNLNNLQFASHPSRKNSFQTFNFDHCRKSGWYQRILKIMYDQHIYLLCYGIILIFDNGQSWNFAKIFCDHNAKQIANSSNSLKNCLDEKMENLSNIGLILQIDSKSNIFIVCFGKKLYQPTPQLDERVCWCK